MNEYFGMGMWWYLKGMRVSLECAWLRAEAAGAELVIWVGDSDE